MSILQEDIKIPDPVSILEKCKGMDIVVNPRTPRDDSSLAAAVNVVITDAEAIEQAPGFIIKQVLVNGHSGFCDDSIVLLCQGTSMYIASYDMQSCTEVFSALSGNRVSYTKVVDAIYFADKSVVGIIADFMYQPWLVDRYIISQTNRQFEKTVPLFSKIAYFFGYMLGALGPDLYSSEFNSMGLFDKTNIIPFESDIIMIKPVNSGVFISTCDNIYFLAGTVPSKFIVGDPVLRTPAIEWSVATDYVEGLNIKGYEQQGLCAMWDTNICGCIGTPDGKVIPLANKKVRKTNANVYEGASVLHKSYAIFTEV